MKILVAYLLAFYVVALSCIPCQDEAVARQSVTTTRIADAGSTHQDAIDLCSPFCICACCASVTISPAVAILPESTLSQLIPPAGFTYLPSSYTGDTAGIWQPPQQRV